jgi:hypothetical protein
MVHRDGQLSCGRSRESAKNFLAAGTAPLVAEFKDLRVQAPALGPVSPTRLDPRAKPAISLRVPLSLHHLSSASGNRSRRSFVHVVASSAGGRRTWMVGPVDGSRMRSHST